MLRVIRGPTVFLAFIACVSASPLTLWYKQPASKWEEALPIGNGRMAAMVFGGIGEERIQFNEETLWTGKPHDYVRAGSGEALTEVRRLLAEGKTKEAEALAREKMLSDPVRQKAYQPFGDIHIFFPGHEDAVEYRRELDLDSAIARTSYRIGRVDFAREVFASYPDNVVVVHLTASEPGSLNVEIALDSPHKVSITRIEAKLSNVLNESQASAVSVTATPVQSALERAAPGQRELVLDGQVETGGLRFEARLRILSNGGSVREKENRIVVERSNEVTLLLVAATSFVDFQNISGDPTARCASTLGKLQSVDFSALRAAHVADHQTLFRRVALVFGGDVDASQKPTDERLAQVKTLGGLDHDPGLAALEFQYGRYLMIASSRPGAQPANLQGKWNALLNPPWESKYTTNINLEMNYWLAELTGLSECADPLFAAIDDLRISGASTAQKLYHSRGWVLHHNFDLWRGTAPINNIDGIWPTGGAWLCDHLWEHWLFSRDRAFLDQRAYPALKEASLFFVDSLIRDPKTKWLVTSPSFSPEQGTMTVGPTMDIQLIRALWEHTISAAKELRVDEELAAKLRGLLLQLPPNQIGKHGQLQEWLNDVDVPNNNHRHMSPLWALYPGADITPAEPAVFAAAKKLLEWRGDGSTGWSYAWRIPLWARANDGEMAYRQLSMLMTKRTLPNLFDLCGPFQIDGNFGATAGITEMLLQSQQRVGFDERRDRSAKEERGKPAVKGHDAELGNSSGNGTVLIDLLPALPKAWAHGAVAGLRARDGFEVDLTWADGRLTRAELHSRLGRPAIVRYGGKMTEVVLRAGESAMFDGALRPTTER